MPHLATVLDLNPRLQRDRDAAAHVAAEPVRFITAELLEALQGSWGEPAELGPELRLCTRSS